MCKHDYAWTMKRIKPSKGGWLTYILQCLKCLKVKR